MGGAPFYHRPEADHPVHVFSLCEQSRGQGYLESPGHPEYLDPAVIGPVALQRVEGPFEQPVGFGILTTETVEQAVERAGTKAGNKGYDAALSVIEMVNLLKDSGLCGEGRPGN